MATLLVDGVALKALYGLYAKPEGLAAFGEAQVSRAFAESNISTRLRAEHLLAQILHETGGLQVLEECLNYRSAERLMEIWPTRFPTEAAASPYVHNPQALANKVYGGRMGNVQPNDGFAFRGRGLLQITGRESYEKYGAKLGIKLAEQPSLAADPGYALRIAALEFSSVGACKAADSDDIHTVTLLVNGGTIGLSDRIVWLQHVRSHKLIVEKS